MSRWKVDAAQFASLFILVCGLLVVITSYANTVAWLMVFCAPLAILFLLHRKHMLGAVSPTVVVVSALVVTGALGLAVGDTIGKVGGVSAHIVLSDSTVRKTGYLFGGAALCVAVAAGCVRALLARFEIRAGTMQQMQIPLPIPGSPTGDRLFLYSIACAIPVIVSVLSSGSLLLDRSTYLIGDTGSFGGLANTLGLAAVVVCGLVFNQASGLAKLPPVLLAFSYFGLYFCLGSRKTALVAPLFFAGALVANRSRKVAVSALVAVVFSLAILPLPLFLRGSSSHGLLPYVDFLPEVLSVTSPYRGAFDNVLFSFPLAGYVAYEVHPISIGTLLSEVSPLPGDLSGWYEVADSLRVNRFTPYSTVGEVGNHGVGAVASYWLLVGCILGYLEYRIKELDRVGWRLPALLLTGIPLMFTLFALQYNLRTSTRLLVYLVVVDLAIYLCRKLVPAAEGHYAVMRPDRYVEVL